MPSSPIPPATRRIDPGIPRSSVGRRRLPRGRGAETTRGAVSENTERALKSDLRVFAAWCAERRLPALPAHAATIAAFVDAMARARAPATVRRYVASIAAVHKALGHAKAARAAPVQLALKRLHRARAAARRRRAGSPGRCASACWPPSASARSTTATAPSWPSHTTACCAARSSRRSRSTI